MVTAEQVKERLALEIKQSSAVQVAERLGFAQSYVSDVMRGDKPISQRLAAALGYERVIMFRPLPVAKRRGTR